MFLKINLSTLKNKSLVYVKFPKTGLGNMLLPWARGVVFARLNNFELVTSSWFDLRWGALFRREQRSRLYWRYFKETPIAKRLLVRFNLNFKKIVIEPTIEKLRGDLSCGNTIYLFNKIIADYDLFASLENYREMINDELHKLLHISKSLEGFEKPVIGIHIRRGDFNLGSTLTPLSFFIEAIKLIRETSGKTWPVTVFTDAEVEELQSLLEMPAIKLAEKKADILDILLLSRSKILILSGSSTFSYWAGFLSNAFVVRPMNDWLKNIKTNSDETRDCFEMKWAPNDDTSTEIFIENILRIQGKS